MTATSTQQQTKKNEAITRAGTALSHANGEDVRPARAKRATLFEIGSHSVFSRVVVHTSSSQEKKNVGELWEERSNGKGLFLFAVDQDDKSRGVYRQLADKINM